MKTVTISMFKMAAIAGLGMALSNCTSNPYDSVTAQDRGAANYRAKLVLPTKKERWDFVVEHQGTRGEGLDSHYARSNTKYNNQTQQYVTTEIRPAITTQDSFAINATSLGVKWNFLDRPALGMNVYLSMMYVGTKADISVPAYLAYAPTRAQVNHSDVFLAPQLDVYVPIAERLRLVSSLWIAGATLSTYSVGVDYLATNKVALGLGYKRWSYDSSMSAESDTVLAQDKLNFSSKSNMSLDSSGISGELTYRF